MIVCFLLIGLYLPGGKKLQEAVVMAFEQKSYLHAMKISLKAEKAVAHLLNDEEMTKQNQVANWKSAVM